MLIEQKYKDILSNGESKGLNFYLPGTLDRKDYVGINKVLESIGAKWNKKQKAHVFEEDAHTAICRVLEQDEYVDAKEEKQKFQFFETPGNIAKYLADEVLALIPKNQLDNIVLLEPSVGYGRLFFNFVDAISTYDDIRVKNSYCIDIQDSNINKFAASVNTFKLHPSDKFPKPIQCITEDFLLITLGFFDERPNVILMNPPFKGGADIKHIRHAYSLLAPGGVLGAICGEGAFVNTRKNEKAFREWIDSVGAHVVPLDVGAFKESGTNVKTRIILIRKSVNEE